MEKQQQKLVIGCLLHDFGKLLYRYNDGRNHSTSGYEYLKDVEGLKEEKEILDCVRYHHSTLLKDSGADKNALCYITYIADNIASAADRRKKESSEGGFVRDISLESVFNILNNNSDSYSYMPAVMDPDEPINYPSKENVSYSESFYSNVINNIRSSLSGIKFEDEYINSLLQVMESNLTFIPSSTQTGELRDISLYDHLKITAAIGLCIEQYLEENNIADYKTELYTNAQQFYKKEAFRLYSFDVSGIQDFIYNISSKSALKGLRARSFYLEILMEDIIDELLGRLSLCRTNVIYTGGGHAYILIPATDKARQITESFELELKQWLIENFGSGLYFAGGYADCSAERLQNNPRGSYKEIFAQISTMISQRKLHRYEAEDIIKLNAPKNIDNSRECSICHRSDKPDDDECIFCKGFKELSDIIISNDMVFFTVVKKTESPKRIPLPFGCWLTAMSEKELKELMISDKENYVRAYSRNKPYTGFSISTNLWVGNYGKYKEFSQLVKNSAGIKRLAVLRADVDNLGQAFVNGFNRDEEQGKYETITRTSVLSRNLSMFFKLHINKLLAQGSFQLFKDKNESKRNAVVVYSGGDDVFIVGGWDDILCFAVDLYESFKRFTQNTLTISAGIGLYPEKYPISSMALLTGELEEISKKYDNESKNAVTFLNGESTYHWEEFINIVIGEKLSQLEEYISLDGFHAKAMLYKMLELIRGSEKGEKLNIARFAYLLARLRPDSDNASDEQTENYNKFAMNMYKWIQDEKDCKQLKTAIYIYIYMTREREEK